MNKIIGTDLNFQHEIIKNELNEAINLVIQDKQFILGKSVTEFEEDFANYLGVNYCVGVGNGSDAIELILKALDIGQGDEVILPSLTYVATASAVLNVGGIPKLVDVDDSATLGIENLEMALTSKTKAIIAVSLYGNPANLESLIKFCDNQSIFLIEDAAQAHGASINNRKVGSFGIASSFSFYPGKNLGAYGDAGAVATNSKEIFNKIKRLRNHGRLSKYDHELIGRNSRLDSIQAAVLSVKLPYLDSWNYQRKLNARKITIDLQKLESIKILNNEKFGTSVFHQFILISRRKKELRKFLEMNGVQTGQHYPYILNELNGLKSDEIFINSKEISEYGLSLPVGEHLSHNDLDYISTKIIDFEKFK